MIYSLGEYTIKIELDNDSFLRFIRRITYNRPAIAWPRHPEGYGVGKKREEVHEKIIKHELDVPFFDDNGLLILEIGFGQLAHYDSYRHLDYFGIELPMGVECFFKYY